MMNISLSLSHFDLENKQGKRRVIPRLEQP